MAEIYLYYEISVPQNNIDIISKELVSDISLDLSLRKLPLI
jgi:hypothetical protein